MNKLLIVFEKTIIGEHVGFSRYWTLAMPIEYVDCLKTLETQESKFAEFYVIQIYFAFLIDLEFWEFPDSRIFILMFALSVKSTRYMR